MELMKCPKHTNNRDQECIKIIKLPIIYFATKGCNVTDYGSNTTTNYNHNGLFRIKVFVRINENRFNNPKELLKHEIILQF